MQNQWLMTCAWAMCLFSTAAGQELPPPAERTVEYGSDIRPILEQHCWSCHGPQQQESGLRLDRQAALLQGGDLGRVVVPGRSADSRLIHYVAGTDPDSVMPPEGERLTPAEIGLLRAWIDQGCEWPAGEAGAEERNTHWAYQPLQVSPPPQVQQQDWPINPIDHFILSELEQRGLQPAPAASRYTLIRRLSLDLTGLLPTVEEVDRFVSDPDPAAYQALVERLLASPHFGERWGRHWLDMARYADSDGYEKDNPRPDAYRWRDWVIDAVNADMPFDQFTIEQLAGDLLLDATPEQRLATAFHRQTLTNTEGGTDQEQFRVEACFDRTETTGAVWLGLTVGCARCHSHKYDALSQREYYQLFAVFNNGDEQTTVVPKSAAEVAAYETARAAHAAQLADVTARLQTTLETQQAAFTEWAAQSRALLQRAAAEPLRLHPLGDLRVSSVAELQFQPQSDGSVLVSGPNPDTADYTLTGQSPAAVINAVRLDVLPDKTLPAQGPGRVRHGNFVLNELILEVAAHADFRDARSVAVAEARADFEQADRPWRAQHVVDGDPATGWAIGPQYGQPHWLLLTLQAPVQTSATPFIRVRLVQQYGRQHTLGRFRLSLQSGFDPGTAWPEQIQQALLAEPKQRTEEQRQQLLEFFGRQTSPARELYAELDRLRKAAPAKPELTVRVIGQRTQEPRSTYVLKRGEFLEPLTEQAVVPGGPRVLPPLQSRQPGAAADRLDLARWLVSEENPLTPRVTANHIWRHLFGHGLVRTPADFGVRGERPSHPALLDWLAADLLGKTPAAAGETASPAWSRKALIRRIVLSATYRQSSRLRPELLEADPGNQWLARQNRLRVEGEIVRDISLDAAGLLSRRVGGPSVFPPLPPGIAELSYAGNFKWKVSAGADRFRRGMYTFFKRTSPHPNLTTFDCPDANLTCVERRTSNTPLQALTSLNNESFAEAARGLADRIQQLPERDVAVRLRTGFRICVARPPRDAELQELASLLEAARLWYQQHPEEGRQLLVDSEAASTGSAANGVAGVAADKSAVDSDQPELRAAWVVVARVLLNLDEFLTRE